MATRRKYLSSGKQRGGRRFDGSKTVPRSIVDSLIKRAMEREDIRAQHGPVRVIVKGGKPVENEVEK